MSLRNERRRRLLSDESVSSDETPLRLAGETDRDAGAYPSAVRSDGQRRILDLLPTRYASIALALLVALVLVAVVELLHVWSDALAGVLEADELGALSLLGTRNVSHWLASMLLTVAGLVAIFIFSLRRHRVDDYHGRYRVWIWTAFGCLVASLFETADAGDLARGLARRAAEVCALDERTLWRAAVGGLLGLAGVRLLFEVRRCRLATALLLGSAASFLLAVGANWGWLDALLDTYEPLLERGSALVGYVFLLGTFLLYARHVGREIDGLVARAPAKLKRKKAMPAASDSAEKKSSPAPQLATSRQRDAEPVEKAAPASTSSRSQNDKTADRVKSADSPSVRIDEAHEGLSRAERRRQRRDSRMAG